MNVFGLILGPLWADRFVDRSAAFGIAPKALLRYHRTRGTYRFLRYQEMLPAHKDIAHRRRRTQTRQQDCGIITGACMMLSRAWCVPIHVSLVVIPDLTIIVSVERERREGVSGYKRRKSYRQMIAFFVRIMLWSVGSILYSTLYSIISHPAVLVCQIHYYSRTFSSHGPKYISCKLNELIRLEHFAVERC